ncbi:MAG: hypothetical protein IJD42_06320 [Clostridia bacterium]|nr:hypothetical protein [Clostridia bacterium]
MKNKVKNFSKKNILTICLAILLVIATIVAVLNVVAMSQIKKITYGMSVEEVKDALGECDSTSGNGFVRHEWRLANGDILVIWFEESEKTGKVFVSGYFVE